MSSHLLVFLVIVVNENRIPSENPNKAAVRTVRTSSAIIILLQTLTSLLWFIAVVPAKGSYGTEGQLHTVIEKSPESSPTTKPRQGGGFPQPHSPTGPSPGPAGPTPQSGRFILPTGKYPVPQPEPHYAQIPSTNQPGPGSSGVYPALAKESSRQQHQGLQGIGGREEGATQGQRGGRTSAMENGYQKNTSSSSYSSSASSSTQPRTQAHEADR